MQLERMRDEFATFVSCATNQCGMNLECAEHTYTPRHPTDVATAGIGHVERFGLWTCVVVPLSVPVLVACVFSLYVTIPSESKPSFSSMILYQDFKRLPSSEYSCSSCIAIYERMDALQKNQARNWGRYCLLVRKSVTSQVTRLVDLCNEDLR